VNDSDPPAPTAEHAEAVVWTDGAARGNPGPAGIGVMLKTRGGQVIATDARFIGHTTNNVAEYRALLRGFELALEHGVKVLEVRADSELLIKQLLGKYRVKAEGLRPLFEQARALMGRFQSVKLLHVRREHNAEADRLANQGIDAANPRS
jgi:ribonuclease HI